MTRQTVLLVMLAAPMCAQISTYPITGGGGGAVSSVNTRTGAVTIIASDVNAVGTITNSTSGNAATSTALATTPTLCTTGQAPTGILASGNATGCATIGGGGSGTVTSVGVVGTANQVTVGGASPITTSGTFTLSLPSTVILPATADANAYGAGPGTQDLTSMPTDSIGIMGPTSISGQNFLSWGIGCTGTQLLLFGAVSSNITLGACTNTTGTGSVVKATSPTLVTPVLTRYTVSTLPGSLTAGATAYVTDGSTATDCTTGSGANTVLCQYSGSAWLFPGGGSAAIVRGIAFSLGDQNASAALTVGGAGSTDFITVPFGCTIGAYNLVVDQADSTFRIKFWKIATGTAIPTSGNSISTSGLGVASGTAIHSATVTDFTTTTVTANDIIAMALSTANAVKYVSGVLQCQ